MKKQGLWVLLAGGLLFGQSAPAQVSQLSIDNYTIVDVQRVSRFDFEYTYTADVTNGGHALVNVAGALSSGSPYLTVIEGAVSFGDVAEKATVTSRDTFVIRHDRRYSIGYDDFIWNLSGDSAQSLVAEFRVDPATGNAPLTANFTPEPITVNAIQRYRWDLDGNGSFELSDTIANAKSYTYRTPGTYQPRLEVLDSLGNVDIQSKTVVVGNSPPIVNADIDPSNGEVPLVVTFSGSATDSDGIAGYQWDFDGDGVFDYSSPSSASTSHIYSTAGTFAAVLRATDGRGAYTDFTLPTTQVRAAPPGSPSVSATASPTSGNATLNINLSGSASNPDGTGITLWEWDFDGDGTFDYSSTADATTAHAYSAVGSFFPRLRVTDGEGEQAEDVVKVMVNAQVGLSRSHDTIDTEAWETSIVSTMLGGDTRVSVVLEDSNGQVAKTLVPWTLRPAGGYQDVWDGSADGGGSVAEGPHYAVLLYEVDGQVRRLDLKGSTGGSRYNPPRSYIPTSFNPLAGQPLTITYTLSQASEVEAFMGRYNTNSRLITFLQRDPQGRGTHALVWNGENSDGELIHPPSGDQFLFGIFAYTLPSNAIYVRSGAHLSNLTVAPSIFDPTGHIDDQGTPATSAIAFDLSKAADIELVVGNAENGTDVARRLYPGIPSGTQTVHWDGKDDNGAFVAPGRYRLGVAAIDANGYRSLRIYALQRIYY